jgi:hypothetical protein
MKTLSDCCRTAERSILTKTGNFLKLPVLDVISSTSAAHGRSVKQGLGSLLDCLLLNTHTEH